MFATEYATTAPKWNQFRNFGEIILDFFLSKSSQLLHPAGFHPGYMWIVSQVTGKLRSKSIDLFTMSESQVGVFPRPG
jgi:hypothetical protein